MKNRDAKMRERYEQKEYYGITRLDKKRMKEERKEKERFFALYECCDEKSEWTSEKEREAREALHKLKTLMEKEKRK